ncbi:GntR family transcriptional regulator [Glaciimonas sp. GNP009]|uniref:GntR family transcriptional regulator n=3 Tax=Glaciimonas sp. CA11.2 TaxID=3048601 RepID=UPI002AB5BE69|nr:GntR family transcriptional regulator [Glaciimonas sp. CA11.2]MDY7544638.1 GntR family transcriptional regulator [Glaciimonas sp. CA11.2]
MPSHLKKLETKKLIDLKTSPIPFYAQVRDALRQKILDGALKPHQKMASESQMIETFGVSRITIRRALHELENEGLIFGVSGKGTFVSKPKAFQNLTHLQSFGEAMQAHGYETFSKVISLKELRASDHVAEKLKVAKNAKVSEIKRVRYLNRDPVSIETSYFPEAIGRRLIKEDLTSKDIFLILENDYGIVLGDAELVVGAYLADDLQARLLGMESGFPMLHIERLTSAANGQPVSYEHLYHHGDSFKYKVRVERSPSKVKK